MAVYQRRCIRGWICWVGMMPDPVRLLPPFIDDWFCGSRSSLLPLSWQDDPPRQMAMASSTSGLIDGYMAISITCTSSGLDSSPWSFIKQVGRSPQRCVAATRSQSIGDGRDFLSESRGGWLANWRQSIKSHSTDPGISHCCCRPGWYVQGTQQRRHMNPYRKRRDIQRPGNFLVGLALSDQP